MGIRPGGWTGGGKKRHINISFGPLSFALTYKAIACSVFLWPAIWALFARGVDRLFALVAEAQFSKALAGMVACSVNPLPWPARVALARRVFAFRAQR